MITLATFSAVVMSIIFLMRRKKIPLEVIITGLIPSLPDASNKAENGTTVLLYWGDRQGKVGDENIASRGYADEHGEYRSFVPFDSVGKVLNCRLRHAAYKPLEIGVPIQNYGAVFSAEMRPDGVYSGKIRGAKVDDLNAHTEKAANRAEKYRLEKFAHLRAQPLICLPFCVISPHPQQARESQFGD